VKIGEGKDGSLDPRYGYWSSERPRNLINGDRPGNITYSTALITVHNGVSLLRRLSQQHDRTTQRPPIHVSRLTTMMLKRSVFGIIIEETRLVTRGPGTTVWLSSGFVPARSRTLNAISVNSCCRTTSRLKSR